jgi:hypothetical protein
LLEYDKKNSYKINFPYCPVKGLGYNMRNGFGLELFSDKLVGLK